MIQNIERKAALYFTGKKRIFLTVETAKEHKTLSIKLPPGITPELVRSAFIGQATRRSRDGAWLELTRHHIADEEAGIFTALRV
ncbi:MAG: hypothetical protein AAB728_00030, partial [Patescibacteria group bacterium]